MRLPVRVESNPKSALVKDDDERLPIHWATAYNRLPVVELLVASKDFDPDVEDGSGWTPLMIASSLKDASGDTIIELLLRKGADVSIKSNTGQNALHFASSKNNISTVRTLIANKCSARVKDKRGQLPLHRAAAVGSVPILKTLLEEGKSPVNATDSDGYTALHQAIAEGHGPAAILLLKSGADPLKRDSDGRLAIELVPDDKVCSSPRIKVDRADRPIKRSNSLFFKRQSGKGSSFHDDLIRLYRNSYFSLQILGLTGVGTAPRDVQFPAPQFSQAQNPIFDFDLGENPLQDRRCLGLA
ncbi:unnamed protein product [Penicillium salamii]|uniref:Uncharacterized protein n=1 Tax=Penicillium salamii TaxID=1612424 RepID=A0A9W4NUE3_9EURO|nr:unnamed protein product [Penicillium salamii]CAG8400679.1 unnamed protein product [Penicillium salamii]CAG8421931.1 unnamed protein product [Penicillium salamii]CAG8431686.1 unnamed protein product [Penicillium salamii]CAG8642661.1 unnamed protein product [Penicillium salamii]